MRILIASVFGVAALLGLTFFVVGTFGPSQPEDRHVPGATTEKGKAKLFENVDMNR